jgi:hypothetical protein
MIMDISSNKTDFTVWASYLTESLGAAFIAALAKERGWKPDEACRVLNLVMLAGGESGKPRNTNVWNIEIKDLRAYLKNDIPMPGELEHFTPTPLQIKIIKGQ